MIRRGWILALAVVLFVPLAVSGGQKKIPKGKTWTWSFAADTLGREPAESFAWGGRWEVAADSTAEGDTIPAARYLRQTSVDEGEGFHCIQFRKPILRDLVVSVRFRILSGEMDPTAGIALQLDSKGRNGYVVRVRKDRGDVVAHYIIYGKRRDIKFAEIESPAAGEWHHLQAERDGSLLIVSYDGVERIRVRDERFREGAVGLWTEDDTLVEFRDLEVTSR